MGCGKRYTEETTYKEGYQLNYGVLNFGNLGRGALDGHSAKTRKTKDLKVSQVPCVQVLFEGYNHFILLCEAAELLKDANLRVEVGRNRYKAFFSRCGNVCVLAKVEKLTLVVDMTMRSREKSARYEDGPDLPYPKTAYLNPEHNTPYNDRLEIVCPETKKTAVWYLIVDIHHGVDDHGERISRSGQEVTRVCVYHVDNGMATSAVGRVRSQLVNMFIVCLYYQVEILGGDTNASSYRYYRTQGMKKKTPKWGTSCLPIIEFEMPTKICLNG